MSNSTLALATRRAASVSQCLADPARLRVPVNGGAPTGNAAGTGHGIDMPTAAVRTSVAGGFATTPGFHTWSPPS